MPQGIHDDADDRRSRFIDRSDAALQESLKSVDSAVSTSCYAMNDTGTRKSADIDTSLDMLEGISKKLAHLTFNSPSPISVPLSAPVAAAAAHESLLSEISPAGGAVLVDLFPNRDGTFTATEGDSCLLYGDSVIGSDKNEDYAQILPRFSSQIRDAFLDSNTFETTKMAAVIQLRRYLSSSRVSVAIKEVLNLSVTNHIVQLGNCDCPRMQYEVCWILTNLCAGSQEQTRSVVAAGALPVLLRLFTHPSSPEVQLQACWCLGNIAGDSPELRTQLLVDGVVGSLQTYFNAVLYQEPVSATTADLPCARMFVWLAANVCRAPKSQSEWSQLSPLFEILEIMIHSSDAEIVVDALWGLSRMLHGINSVEATSAADSSAGGSSSRCSFPRISSHTAHVLVSVLNGTRSFDELGFDDERGYRVRKPALRAITNAASGDNLEIRTLVEAGIVPVLLACVDDKYMFVQCEALLALSNIAAANEALVRNLMECGTARVWLRLLTDEDNGDVIKKEVLWGLLNVATLNDSMSTMALFAAGDWRPALFDIISNARENVKLANKAADIVCRLAILDGNISSAQNTPPRFLTRSDAVHIEQNVLPLLYFCGHIYSQIANLCIGLKSGSLEFLLR